MNCSFSNFSIEPGRVEFSFADDTGGRGSRRAVTFDLETGTKPALDLVALACSTLAGQRNDSIHIDLPLGSETVEAIARFTGAEITCIEESPEHAAARRLLAERRRSYQNLALSFSGGMDSLGLLGALPEGTALVSMDWGGSFRRERAMYERFSPHIVRSNLVEVGLNQNCTEFMGTGILLLCDELQLRYFAFGSILESLFSLFSRSSTRTGIYGQPFDGAGLTHVSFATGFTEVATTRLCCHYYPNEILPSLHSLAAPGSVKLHRKQALIEIDGERWGSSTDMGEPALLPRRPQPWGTDVVDDFVSLYILKHRGMDGLRGRVAGVPAAVLDFVERHSLRFMDRINPTFEPGIPEHLRPDFFERLAAAGIFPYDGADFEEFYLTGDLLRSTRLPKDEQPSAHPAVRLLRRAGLERCIAPLSRVRNRLRYGRG